MFVVAQVKLLQKHLRFFVNQLRGGATVPREHSNLIRNHLRTWWVPTYYALVLVLLLVWVVVLCSFLVQLLLALWLPDKMCKT